MSLRSYRGPALLMLLLNLQACYAWQPSAMSISDVMAGDPGTIRVTTTGGATLTYDEPRLIGDSITTAEALAACPPAETEPCRITRIDGRSIAPIPLDEVTSVEFREFSPGRTVGAVVLTGVAALGFAFLLACSGDDSFIC